MLDVYIEPMLYLSLYFLLSLNANLTVNLVESGYLMFKLRFLMSFTLY